MRYYLVALLIYIISHRFTISGTRVDNDDPESAWSTGMGNSQSTYRIVPSMATNYSKLPWTYEFNLTSQDCTEFGHAAGINGDIYFFISQIRSHPGDFIVCLTVNGNVRWTLFVEPVEDMEPNGISNIIADRQGQLFYTISYMGDSILTAKICRITQAQTSHPVQKCEENYDVFAYVTSAMALDEKYDLLVAAVSDNEIETVPAVLDKNTLKLVWINRHVFGAGMNGQYRFDTNTGDMFWIGGDGRMIKFDRNGKNLINNYTSSGLADFDFVLDRQNQIIVQPWQNGSSLPWKLLVSSHDLSGRQIKERWRWEAPPLIADNDGITPPSIDEKGTAYMASMPLVFAIDTNGKTVWTTRLATSSEMQTSELYSSYLGMNTKRRVLYVVSGSIYNPKTKFFYFITAVNMDTGKVIKRINLNLGTDRQISPQCLILVGDEMLYFSWLTGAYPKSVPFKVMGIPQV